ncbi:MAG TPA: hypothetical protein VFW75_01520, partial [Acetobacteraceae bacterium]|nr:hypothetical protein [Acetobacteraceae bacterium]
GDLAIGDAGALRRAFDRRYRERFARSLDGIPVELVSWRVRAVAPPSVSEIRFAGTAACTEAMVERRPAYFVEAGGFVDTPVYLRAALTEDAQIDGPALIEEAESTAVIGPSAVVSVDRFGNLIMRLPPEAG